VEVAQLYVRDVAASITRPVRELKAYQRVSLAPGESKEVTFALTRHDLTFVGRNLRPTVEAGEFHVWIAPSAEAEGLSGRFVLAADRT
jgi:beta-glucosidase